MIKNFFRRNVFAAQSFSMCSGFKQFPIEKLDGFEFDSSEFQRSLEPICECFSIPREYYENPEESDVVKLLTESFLTLSEEDNFISLDLEEDELLTIVGDTHGGFFDVLSIFQRYGCPSKENNHKYLFTGDYVDRGNHSVENIIMLLYLKTMLPDHVHLLRGNHEDSSLNLRFGFYNDVVNSYMENGNWIFNWFQEIFRRLPLGCVVNENLFACHGGIGFDEDQLNVSTISDLIEDRSMYLTPTENSFLETFLWSDPLSEEEDDDDEAVVQFNDRRGAGKLWGNEHTTQFLKENNFNCIIRSHEAPKSVPNGYTFEHEDRILTIFSCPNYFNPGSNKGAVVQIKGKQNTVNEKDVFSFEGFFE